MELTNPLSIGMTILVILIMIGIFVLAVEVQKKQVDNFCNSTNYTGYIEGDLTINCSFQKEIIESEYG